MIPIGSNFAQGVVRVEDHDGCGCEELGVAGEDADGTGGTDDEA